MLSPPSLTCLRATEVETEKFSYSLLEWPNCDHKVPPEKMQGFSWISALIIRNARAKLSQKMTADVRSQLTSTEISKSSS